MPHHPAYWLRHGNLADVATGYRALSTLPALSTDGVAIPPNRRDSLAKIDLTFEAAGAFTAVIAIYGYKPAVQIELADATVPAVAGVRGAGWTNLGQINVSGTGAGGAQPREAHQLEGVTGFTRLAGRVLSSTGAPDAWIDFGFSIPEEA